MSAVAEHVRYRGFEPTGADPASLDSVRSYIDAWHVAATPDPENPDAYPLVCRSRVRADEAMGRATALGWLPIPDLEAEGPECDVCNHRHPLAVFYATSDPGTAQWCCPDCAPVYAPRPCVVCGAICDGEIMSPVIRGGVWRCTTCDPGALLRAGGDDEPSPPAPAANKPAPTKLPRLTQRWIDDAGIDEIEARRLSECAIDTAASRKRADRLQSEIDRRNRVEAEQAAAWSSQPEAGSAPSEGVSNGTVEAEPVSPTTSTLSGVAPPAGLAGGRSLPPASGGVLPNAKPAGEPDGRDRTDRTGAPTGADDEADVPGPGRLAEVAPREGVAGAVADLPEDLGGQAVPDGAGPGAGTRDGGAQAGPSPAAGGGPAAGAAPTGVGVVEPVAAVEAHAAVCTRCGAEATGWTEAAGWTCGADACRPDDNIDDVESLRREVADLRVRLAERTAELDHANCAHAARMDAYEDRMTSLENAVHVLASEASMRTAAPADDLLPAWVRRDPEIRTEEIPW